MRVLLVTWTDRLQQKLSILNPELEYCAIVVDEVEPAKEILKRVNLNFLDNGNFLVERSLRYFKEHVAEFDMFATGMSYAETGLDVTRFKRKLFNFARSSQDLYYNFQVAKHATTYGGA